MTPILALFMALAADPIAVTSVSVLPAEGRTEIVIEFDGTVQVRDFQLHDPERLVVDLTGARQTLPQARFPEIERGGVRGLRVSQYQPEVVRLVFDLDAPVEYSLKYDDGRVRVSFPNGGAPFDPWHTRAGPGSAAPAKVPSISDTRPTPPAPPLNAPARAVQPPITVFFKGTPIGDVIATFAEFSGRSIVTGQGITGSVDADIRNQPWDVALAAVLSAHGFSAQEMESGIIRVDRIENLREQEKVEELVTRPFRIRYASVDSLIPAVEGLLSARGKATTSSATNTIVVTDGRSVIEGRIAPMIEELDARTPQVEIAAKIIFINRTAMDQLGVSYSLHDRTAPIFGLEPGEVPSVGLSGSAIAALGNATADGRVTNPSVQFISSLVLGRYNLNTFIDALTSVNVADVEARPVVRTLDHREASVLVGEETPLQIPDLGGLGQGRYTTQLKPTGIILNVTPHVTGNQVLLEVHAERSGIRLMAEAVTGFVFDKQESKVHVLVENGETVVISGLTIVEKNKATIGIPILKRLPIVGALFRKTLDQEEKKDLLIMVTPHIIREAD